MIVEQILSKDLQEVMSCFSKRKENEKFYFLSLYKKDGIRKVIDFESLSIGEIEDFLLFSEYKYPLIKVRDEGEDK